MRCFCPLIQKSVSQINYMVIMYCEYSVLNYMTHSNSFFCWKESFKKKKIMKNVLLLCKMLICNNVVRKI